MLRFLRIRRLAVIDSRGLYCRDESNQNSRHSGDTHRKQQDRPVQTQSIQARDLSRRPPDQQGGAPFRQKHSTGTGEQTQ